MNDESPLQRLEYDPVLRHVKELARANDPEPSHCFQVTRLAAMIFEATSKVHGLDHHDLRLLLAAALLHDTGYGVNPGSHHKGSRDFVLRADLPDVSKTERAVIACVARYHRGTHPKPSHKVYADLSADDQARVRKLAALLRIADGLDRGHDAACTEISAELEGETLRIHVAQREPSEVDLWGANRKKGLFEDVYRLHVEITAKRGPKARPQKEN